jgi:hypothetical protein
MSSMFFALVLNRLKAIIAFFLTGLATLIIQSIEQGGGFAVPASVEDWLQAAVAAAIVAIGVERTSNKPLPTNQPGPNKGSVPPTSNK